MRNKIIALLFALGSITVGISTMLGVFLTTNIAVKTNLNDINFAVGIPITLSADPEPNYRSYKEEWSIWCTNDNSNHVVFRKRGFGKRLKIMLPPSLLSADTVICKVKLVVSAKDELACKIFSLFLGRYCKVTIPPPKDIVLIESGKLRCDKHNYYNCFLIGRMHEQRGDPLRAYEYYRKTLEYRPSMSESAKRIASICLEDRDYICALYYLSKKVLIGDLTIKDEETIERIRAKAIKQKKDIEKALDEFQQTQLKRDIERRKHMLGKRRSGEKRRREKDLDYFLRMLIRDQ